MRALVLLAFVLPLHAAASARELVHTFPPSGPTEVAGATRANRVLRAMQNYSAPTFTDVLAMHVAHTLRGASDERVMVRRAHRRGGAEAHDALARAAPDGGTLLLAALGRHADPRSTPVGSVATMPYVWVAGAAPSLRSLESLLRGDSARPLAAHPGDRTPARGALDALRVSRLVAIEPIAYNGGVAALNAVASGHVSVALVPLPAVLPYAGSGRLRLLALADTRRHPAAAHVPTGRETGLSGAEAVTAFAVFARAETPQADMRRIGEALARVGDSRDAQDALSGAGLRLEYREAVVSARPGCEPRGTGSRPQKRPPECPG